MIKSFSILDSPGYSTPITSDLSDFNKSTLNSPRLHAILTQNDRITEPQKGLGAEKKKLQPVGLIEEEKPEVLLPNSSSEKILVEREFSETEVTTESDEVSEELEKIEDDDIKPHMFYTPDEDEIEEKEFSEIQSISYVPPFNNPIYPCINYTSIIGECHLNIFHLLDRSIYWVNQTLKYHLDKSIF